MPEKIIKKFDVKFLQVLDESGEADGALMPDVSDEWIKSAFETMVLVRTFNDRALSLQREGRIGTYASILGQEASQVGSALALNKDKGDWVFPSFRESGVYVTLGYPAELLFRYWRGDERGMEAPAGLNIFPMSVPVGSQIPHAAGAAIAMKLKGAESVAVTYFGDGGSSRGDFHEALNMAGVFKAPVLFLCQNNQWAISLPRRNQSAAETIAQRASGYGIEGLQVDGNDIFAVYRATLEAAERARKGEGATLIESFTYRLDDHTTADDASRYRSKEEVEKWMKREPLIRLRLFMEKKGLWTEEYEKEAIAGAEAEVDAAIKEAEAVDAPPPSDMIKFTNAELSVRQIKELKDLKWER
ncbi:MAG: pyruvate dehydrogenase (acetyl-transferring) E1 component subunit alpha [Thermodesulfobacteriota bacterium]